jgi:hypothetical protein
MDFKPVSAVLVTVCLLAGMLLLPSSVRAVALGGTGWAANATAFRGQNYVRYRYICPAGGTFGSVWGTDTYTDDSSVCTAAVNAGVLNPNVGGTVIIEIRPGLKAYVGSTRHGVTTRSYGAWVGSYVFVHPAPVAQVGSKTGKVSLTFLSAAVIPGAQQAALVVTAPDTSVVIVVNYPDGSQVVVGPKRTAVDGKLVYSWNIPKGVHGTVHITVVSAAGVAQSSFTVQ